MINDRFANKVEAGKKRKFEGSSRSDKYGRCPKEVTCLKCGKTGHYAQKCPTEEEVCFKCSKEGHFKQDFPMRATKPSVSLKHYVKYYEKVTCFKCGKHGHYADECAFNTRVCYECTEEWHFKQDCPKKKGVTKPNVSLKHYGRCYEEVTCFKCGKNGHYVNVYTSNKRLCYGCRDKGHISKDFPKKNDATSANTPRKPKSILDEATDNARNQE
ncbi:hypothetical protein Lser_V15G28501 [Lactuca serriola]